MTHFDTIRDVEPDDEEVGYLSAIYGEDNEKNECFLIVGKSKDDMVFVTDISDKDFPAREYNKGDSALEIAEHYGIVSKIRFFNVQDFDLTITF